MYEYLGIPYAKPPVKELRFARPESFKPWSGKRAAKEFGSACPQPRFDIPNFKREIGQGKRRITVLLDASSQLLKALMDDLYL